MNNKKHMARTERLQQKTDAGLVSAHFPEVASIVIRMMYRQRGIAKSLSRTVNFFPGSHAFFRVDCLSKDCIDGGFDLTHVITSMIGHRKEASEGELSCDGNGLSSEHSAIEYQVAIRYE